MPPLDWEELKQNPPTTVESFSNAVFLAEGLDPALADRGLWRAVACVVEDAFNQGYERYVRLSRKGSVCEWKEVEPMPPKARSKLGLAISTIGRSPIHGLRHPPEAGTCGWHIWCGDGPSDGDDFFQPLHVEHLGRYIPEFVEYLELPPGFRVLIDGANYEDVWFDKELLHA